MIRRCHSSPGGPSRMGAEARLTERNITLPQPATPLANYVGAVRVGNLMFVSGHGPLRVDGKPSARGKVGRELTVEQGYQGAREGGLALLATIRASVGSLDRIKPVVKVLGMVNSAEGFGDQPRVVNGFSDLMVEVFGDAIGKHARSAEDLHHEVGEAVDHAEIGRAHV